MDFDYTEEQMMIRNMVRDFAEKEIIPVAKENNRNEHFPRELAKRMGEMGFFGLMMPAEYGGGEADHVSYCVMMEELGYADMGMAITISSHTSLVCKNIIQWGTDEQKKKYLPALTSGEWLGCFGATEPNVGSDVASVETTAAQQGDEWVLNGNKMWITNGNVAQVAVVIAQTDKARGSKGLAAFIVERGTPGFSSRDIHNKLGVRSSSTGELILEDCRVPQGNMLGPVGKGLSVALSGFDSGRLGVAARTVGTAQACIDASVEYARTRTQFGKPVGSFQLVQEMLADMQVETDAARLLTYRAATLKDKGDPATVQTSKAKYYASEMAFRVADKALQIHGSYGYSDEYPVERFLRDIRVSSILEGTSQVHKLIIGRSMTGLSAFA